MKKHQSIIILTIATIGATIVSCGNQNTEIDHGKKPVNGVILTIDKPNIYLDETALLKVEVLPNDASDLTYTFKDYNTDLIKIEGYMVKPLNAGETTIKVVTNDGNFEDSVSISISERDDRTMVDQRTYLDTLKKSPYRDNIKTDGFMGLDDASLIGVEKERLSQELYPVPTEGKVYAVEDYGVTFDGDNNSGALNILIESIKNESGNKIIKFKSGIYKFSQTISIVDANDIYLVGEEDTKLIYNGWLTYIKIERSTNIHLNNLKFDMNPSPTIMGKIVSVSDNSGTSDITLKIDDEFDLSNSIYKFGANLKSLTYAELFVDESTNWWVPNRHGNLFYNTNGLVGIPNISYDPSNKEMKVTLSHNFPYHKYTKPEIGTNVHFGFTVYEHFGFALNENKNTYFENITTSVAAGMGLRANLGENLYLNRVNFAHSEDSTRALTCTADIIHTCGLKGELNITNSVIEGSHDDGLNIKTFYGKIENARNNVITVTQTQSEVTIPFEEGDMITIYDKAQGLKDYGDYKILKSTKLGGNYTLELDRPVKRSFVGYLVGNDTQSTQLTLDNCIIRNKRNRGILLQARRSLIKNCTFQNVVHGALQNLCVVDSFAEAIVPRDIKFFNNKFLGNWDAMRNFVWGEQNKVLPNTLRNLEIYNNFFYNNVGVDTYLSGVGNAKIKNNLYYKDEMDYTSSSIYLRYSDNILLENNMTYFEEGKKPILFKQIEEETSVTNVTKINNQVKVGI